jgi:hypothetical protein
MRDFRKSARKWRTGTVREVEPKATRKWTPKASEVVAEVKIGKRKLRMSSGEVRTFRSGGARNRFERYVQAIKHGWHPTQQAAGTERAVGICEAWGLKAKYHAMSVFHRKSAKLMRGLDLPQTRRWAVQRALDFRAKARAESVAEAWGVGTPKAFTAVAKKPGLAQQAGKALGGLLGMHVHLTQKAKAAGGPPPGASMAPHPGFAQAAANVAKQRAAGRFSSEHMRASHRADIASKWLARKGGNQQAVQRAGRLHNYAAKAIGGVNPQLAGFHTGMAQQHSALAMKFPKPKGMPGLGKVGSTKTVKPKLTLPRPKIAAAWGRAPRIVEGVAV